MNLLDDPIINYGWYRCDDQPYEVGDEYLHSCIAWMPVTALRCKGDKIRRRIEAPAGYELVPLDERIGEGFLVYDRDDREVRGARGQVNWSERTPRRSAPYCPHVGAFFRPIKDEWIKIATRLPKPEEYPIWVTDGTIVATSRTRYPEVADSELSNRPNTIGQTAAFDRRITHWKRCQLPTPPVPERSAEELAYEKWMNSSTGSNGFRDTFRQCWLAAIKFASTNPK